jgi:hypothetical protein
MIFVHKHVYTNLLYVCYIVKCDLKLNLQGITTQKFLQSPKQGPEIHM